MADQDFQINIKATADIGAIQLTKQQLDALQSAAKQGNVEAINALKQIEVARKAAASEQGSSFGLGGSIAGVATIVTVLTSAIRRWKEFNEEQDRIIEKMEEMRVKSYELGLSVADMLDEMKFKELLDAAPLETQLSTLTSKAIQLKTELRAAFENNQFEDAKRYVSQLKVVEGQINQVNSALDRKAKASEKAAEEAERDAIASAREAQDFLTKAVQTSQPQVQAVLKNEEAARQARQAGLEKDADLYQKSADDFKKTFTESQLQEYESFQASTRLGPRAGPGESQQALDDIARNQINFQRQLSGQPPLPTQSQGNQDLIRAIAEAFDQSMQKVFGP